MKIHRPHSYSGMGQQGFGLMELMVALTIGFVIVSAVGYLYLGSSQAFRTTDNMSRMQENARYALESMARNIRMAGYIGCGNLEVMAVNNIANPPAIALTASTAITGFDWGVGGATFGGVTRAAGDTISVMAAFGGGVNLDGNVVPANANVQIVGNPYGYAENDVLIVTSCTNADTFRATTVSASGQTISHANSSNTGNRVGSYGSNDLVMKVEQYTYFVGVNPSTSKRALYRIDLTANPVVAVELVENVEDMQIEYGIDNNGDAAADTYGNATAVGINWPQVVSARIHLLMASADINVASSAQTYTFNGAAVNAPDRRMYQVFTTTVGLRNRLP